MRFCSTIVRAADLGAFLTKIEATISNSTVPKLLYSTTFGGIDARGESVALDPKGKCYQGGTTPGTLTTTAGAFDTTFNGGPSDAFIAKFNTTFNATIGVSHQRPVNSNYAIRTAPVRLIN